MKQCAPFLFLRHTVITFKTDTITHDFREMITLVAALDSLPCPDTCWEGTREDQEVLGEGTRQRRWVAGGNPFLLQLLAARVVCGG